MNQAAQFDPSIEAAFSFFRVAEKDLERQCTVGRDYTLRIQIRRGFELKAPRTAILRQQKKKVLVNCDSLRVQVSAAGPVFMRGLRAKKLRAD